MSILLNEYFLLFQGFEFPSFFCCAGLLRIVKFLFETVFWGSVFLLRSAFLISMTIFLQFELHQAIWFCLHSAAWSLCSPQNSYFFFWNRSHTRYTLPGIRISSFGIVAIPEYSPRVHIAPFPMVLNQHNTIKIRTYSYPTKSYACLQCHQT